MIKNGTNIECETCKKFFYKNPSQMRDKNYCSRACHYSTIIKKCEVCGIAIKAKKGSSDRKRFCSRKCLGINASKHKNFAENQNRVPWNKGLKGSQVAWNKGKPHYKLRGSNNKNWRGGVTPENERIRHSIEYKEWRTKVFERDGFCCVKCGRKRIEGDRVVLNADHILPFAIYPDLRFDINNGRTLCVECHRETDTHGVNFLKALKKKDKLLNYTED